MDMTKILKILFAQR